MPRFFFHVDDGEFVADHAGVEFPDLASARMEALHSSGAMINDLNASFWAHRSPWNMHVTDEAGRLLFSLTFGSSVPSGEVIYRPSEITGAET